jgi:hypothetical protein
MTLRLRHKRTESLGSQDRTKLPSVSGRVHSPEHGKHLEVINKSTKVELDTTAKTFELVYWSYSELEDPAFRHQA